MTEPKRDPRIDPKPGDWVGFESLREGSRGPEIQVLAVVGLLVAYCGGYLANAVTWITLDNWKLSFKDAKVLHVAD